MTSGVVETSGLESLVLATLPPPPPPPLQPEVALTAGEEDLDEIVALCDDLEMREGRIDQSVDIKVLIKGALEKIRPKVSHNASPPGLHYATSD